jgi:CxxC motif-containing protein (DUF1111 family)
LERSSQQHTPIVASGASLDASIGRELFDRNWVPAPSSTKSNDGLGPLYNATSCGACHIRDANADVDEASVPRALSSASATRKAVAIRSMAANCRRAPLQTRSRKPIPISHGLASATRREASIKLFSQGYGPLGSDTKLALRRPSSLFGIGFSRKYRIRKF